MWPGCNFRPREVASFAHHLHLFARQDARQERVPPSSAVLIVYGGLANSYTRWLHHKIRPVTVRNISPHISPYCSSRTHWKPTS